MTVLRTSTLFALAVLALLGAAPWGEAAGAGVFGWPDPSEMRFEGISFNPPEPERIELGNGVVVYFLENRDLPIVEGAIYVRAGAVFESKEQTGLAALTAGLLRSGGAGGLSPDEVDEELEFIAAHASASAGTFLASVSFTSLSEFFGRALEIVSDMLQDPAFDPERLEIARARFVQAIRQSDSDLIALARREYVRILAGDHPMGAQPTEDLVRSFTRDDVVEFHRRFYRPEGAVAFVTGDIDRETLQDLLERTIGAWRPAGGEPVSFPPFNEQPEPKVYHIQKELTQSAILMGYSIVPPSHPDYPALVFANTILGGNGSGLQHRLITELRLKRGLAYVANSGLLEWYIYPAFFYAGVHTRPDATGQVIELLKAEYRRLIDEPIPEDELGRNRDQILNQAVFRFATPADVVHYKAVAEIYGLPPDYHAWFIERIQTLTAEEIQAAARRWVHPDRLVTVVIGDAAQFDRPLDVFGEVETIVSD